MSIEKIHRSIYFHEEIKQTDTELLAILGGLLGPYESISFYRPCGPILAKTDENPSLEPPSDKEKTSLSEGGIESNITQVIVFQDKTTKIKTPFYCSKDQTCFALFRLKKSFESLSALSGWYAMNHLREKSPKAYNLISLIEKPSDATEPLSPEILQTIIEHINTRLLLNSIPVRTKIFPKKYAKGYLEPMLFDPILKMTFLPELNLYLMKMKAAFALIGKNELLALQDYQPQENNSNQKNESVSTTLSATNIPSCTTTTTTATSGPFFTLPQNSRKRTRSEAENCPEKTENSMGNEQETEEKRSKIQKNE